MYAHMTSPTIYTIHLQALGGVMIGLGVWLEIEGDEYRDIVNDDDELFIAPYLIVAAGCAVIVVAVIGMIGACYDAKLNRFLLVLVRIDTPNANEL